MRPDSENSMMTSPADNHMSLFFEANPPKRPNRLGIWSLLREILFGQ
jgi:hypothetical protein